MSDVWEDALAGAVGTNECSRGSAVLRTRVEAMGRPAESWQARRMRTERCVCRGSRHRGGLKPWFLLPGDCVACQTAETEWTRAAAGARARFRAHCPPGIPVASGAGSR